MLSAIALLLALFFFLFLVIKAHVLIAIILGVLLKFMYSPSNGKHFDKPINDKEDLSTDAAQKKSRAGNEKYAIFFSSWRYY